LCSTAPCLSRAQTAATFPSALVYIGERRHAFADKFEHLGRIYRQY
jgi:hypothetical protein